MDNVIPSHNLTPVQMEIQRHVDRVDQLAQSYEAKWGIGFLYENASSDLQQKWDTQMENYHAAICANNLKLVAELEKGIIRGWQALEKHALGIGLVSNDDTHWEIKLENGFRMILCRDPNSAKRVAGSGEHKGCVILSLQEAAKLIHARYKMVWEVKQHIPDAVVKEINSDFDFEQGDDIPF